MESSALLIASVVGLTACGEKDPEFTVPEELSVAYGSTLGDLPLPEGFSWQDELITSVGEVGQNTFLVTFTPEDTDKYKTVTDIEVTVNVTVNKVAAVIDTQNAVTAFTYDGQSHAVTGATGTGAITAITYQNNAFTDAGTYEVRVLCAESDNYLAGETTVVATVASADLAGLAFPNETFVYVGGVCYKIGEDGRTLSLAEELL